MADEWLERSVAQLAELFDGPHATPAKTESGPVFLGISNLANGRLDLTDTEHLSDDDYARWTRRVQPKAGDVVFSYETRLGNAARIPEGLRCCLGRRMGLLRGRESEIDERFLLYAYLGPQFQELLRSRTIHGSTVDRISLIDMPRFPIVVPSDRNEQRAISHILGALDDKIEVNRRMAATLESMARALFKSWFVDYAPVRAKAEGGNLDVPRHLASLFPDRLVESEGVDIPDGWSKYRIDELATPLSGGTPRKSDAALWIGSLPWVSPKCMISRHLFDAPDRVSEKAIGRGTRLVPAGSIFVMVRGMGLHRGLRISQARRPMTFNQDVKALVPTNATASFILFGLLSVEKRLHSQVKPAGHGTGVLETEALLGTRLACPPSPARAQLSSPFDDFNERIATLEVQSTTVAALRDALLPKLISGELRVKDAERFLVERGL